MEAVGVRGPLYLRHNILKSEPIRLLSLPYPSLLAETGTLEISFYLTYFTDSPNFNSCGLCYCLFVISGIRGDVSILVKIDLFSDFNKFRQSSCGVQFYCSKETLICSFSSVWFSLILKISTPVIATVIMS